MEGDFSSPARSAAGSFSDDAPVLLATDYQKNVEYLEAENWTLKMLLAQKTVRLDSFLSSKNASKDIVNTLSEQDATIGDLKRQLEIANSEIDQLREVLNNRDEEEAMNLLDKSAEASIENTSLLATIENLEAEKSELIKDLKDLTDGTETALAENEALREENAGLIDRLEKLTEVCNEREREQEEMRKQSAQSQLLVSQGDICLLSEQIRELEERAEEMDDKMQKVNDEKQTLEESMADLERENEELKSSNSGMDEGDFAALEEQIRSAETQRDEAIERNEALEVELEALTETISNLEREVEKLKKKEVNEMTDVATSPVDESFDSIVKELEEKNEQMECELNRLRSEKDKVEQAADETMKRQMNVMETQRDEAVEYGRELETEVEGLKAELTRLASVISDMERDNGINARTMQADIDSLNRQIKIIEMQRDEAVEQNEELEMKNASLERDNSEIKTRRSPSYKESDLRTAEAERDAARKEVASLRLELMNLEGDNERLNANVTALRRENAGLQRNALTSEDSLTRRIKELEETNERLEQELLQLRAKVTRLRDSSPDADRLSEVDPLATNSTISFENDEDYLERDGFKAHHPVITKTLFRTVDGSAVTALISRSKRFLDNMYNVCETIQDRIDETDARVSRVRQAIPILLSEKNLYPLTSLRNDLVAFIRSSQDIMRDLNDGAKACIRVAAHRAKRSGRVVPVPLTSDERKELCGLEAKYTCPKAINSRSVLFIEDDDMSFSPIPQKSGLDKRTHNADPRRRTLEPSRRAGEHGMVKESVWMRGESSRPGQNGEIMADSYRNAGEGGMDGQYAKLTGESSRRHSHHVGMTTELYRNQGDRGGICGVECARMTGEPGRRLYQRDEMATDSSRRTSQSPVTTAESSRRIESELMTKTTDLTRVTTQFVQLVDVVQNLVSVMWGELCQFEPCPDIKTLATESGGQRMTILFNRIMKLFSVRIVSNPRVRLLIESLRDDVQGHMKVLAEEHKALIARVDNRSVM